MWLWRERGPRALDLLLFTAVFVVWFIVPNVFKLAPWIWDNIKVLFYWFVGLAPLVALGLAAAFRRGTAWRTGAVAALLVMTLAGGLDVWRVVSRQTEYGEFDGDAIAVATLIRDETEPRATDPPRAHLQRSRVPHAGAARCWAIPATSGHPASTTSSAKRTSEDLRGRSGRDGPAQALQRRLHRGQPDRAQPARGQRQLLRSVHDGLRALGRLHAL